MSKQEPCYKSNTFVCCSKLSILRKDKKLCEDMHNMVGSESLTIKFSFGPSYYYNKDCQ